MDDRRAEVVEVDPRHPLDAVPEWTAEAELEDGLHFGIRAATRAELQPILDAIRASKRPVMRGFQAEGASPIVAGHPFDNPETIATAIRIGNPASWAQAEEARDTSGGVIEAVTDDEILEAHRILSAEVGVFVEPASAAGVAGVLKRAKAGLVPKDALIVITVTGHGLKDPAWALKTLDGADVTPTKVTSDVVSIAAALGLVEN